MRVGVTGHQERDGIDWVWTRTAIAGELVKLGAAPEGWSSLAIGTDQMFARIVLELGGAIVTVVPGNWYEGCFRGDGLVGYRTLLAAGRTITLHGLEGEEAFFAAGVRVADSTEVLVAVWDGRIAKGRGGTADVVAHALRQGKPVAHINPIDRTVMRLPS